MAGDTKSEKAVVESTMVLRHIYHTPARYKEYGSKVLQPGDVIEVPTEKGLVLLGRYREKRACCGAGTTQPVRYFERVSE